jgi:hypothetical protein
LRKVLSHLDVGTNFLDLLFAFGGKPKDSEAGLGGLTLTHRPDGSFGTETHNCYFFIFVFFGSLLILHYLDICYIMVYVEEIRGKEKTSRPIRQTAVFHRFVPEAKGSFWIFLHPMRNSILQQRLETTFMQENPPEYSKMGPLLHSVVISSYIENLRWYLNALNEEFEEIVSYPRYEGVLSILTDFTKGRYRFDSRLLSDGRLPRSIQDFDQATTPSRQDPATIRKIRNIGIDGTRATTA